jgi:two-component system sensor histidine kinase/response regulator
LGKSKQHRRSFVPRPDLRGKRVLVVDDSEYARAVLTSMLNAMTFRVDEVSSGHDAVVAVEQAAKLGKPYDAIFMDWKMPDIDGIEAIRVIRSMGLKPEPKQLLVTAYDRDDVLRLTGSTPLDDILVKPFSAATLFDSVVRLFGMDAVSAEPRQAPAGPALMSDLSDLAGARILLVEDNEINQQIGQGLLEEAGFVVEIAENGQEAVDKVGHGNYELVLMDMQMPVMDGTAATMAIRQLPGFASMPIVAMTANVMQEDRERCFSAGMNDYLGKPIDPNDLWAALRKWIKPRSPSAHPDKPTQDANPSLIAIPTDIEGLNTVLGLRRVLGKRELYLLMLNQFIASQRSVPDRIANLLAANDLAVAERLAHTLKGLAGNIGALPLQQSSGQLEAGLRKREPKDRLNVLLADTSRQLSALVDALGGQQAAAKELVASEQEISAPELEKVVSQLATLWSDHAYPVDAQGHYL